MEKILNTFTEKFTHDDLLTRLLFAVFFFLLVVGSWWWMLSMKGSTVIDIGPIESQLSIDKL